MKGEGMKDDTNERLEKAMLYIYRICNALIAIVDHECCDYGFKEEVDMAEEYVKDYEKDHKV